MEMTYSEPHTPWAALWNSRSEQSSTLSHIVKQPIRAELNIIIHDPSK